jgi:N-hydroxyarylamine O-acetyltransferase
VINLENYLKRIAVPDQVKVTEAFLQKIATAHACSIPFENMDVVCGLGVSLDLADIEDKLVTRQRGGYCFEQNALLASALKLIGFQVRELSARVWYNTPPGMTPPRTHLFLVVELNDQRWLVDCGVGGSNPPGILRFDLSGASQTVGTEQRRLIALQDRLVPTYMHQVLHQGTWMDVYDFTGEEMPKIDQEMGNWWTSSHPESKFRKNLIVAILNVDGTRCTIVNREFVRRAGSEVIEKQIMTCGDDLTRLLQRHFHLEIDARKVWQNLTLVGTT